MDVKDMRKAVSDEYDGEKWKDKVRNMSDAQVVAIYYRMIGCGQVKQNRGPVYKRLDA
jgi:hypothetical protein